MEKRAEQRIMNDEEARRKDIAFYWIIRFIKIPKPCPII